VHEPLRSRAAAILRGQNAQWPCLRQSPRRRRKISYTSKRRPAEIRHESGFAVTHADSVPSVRAASLKWNDVRAVLAYKCDLYATARIGLGFTSHDGTIEVDEEMPGWSQLVEKRAFLLPALLLVTAAATDAQSNGKLSDRALIARARNMHHSLRGRRVRNPVPSRSGLVGSAGKHTFCQPDSKNPGSPSERTRISNSCNPKTQIPQIRLLQSQHALTIGAQAEHGG
jgi:hypothetical protein